MFHSGVILTGRFLFCFLVYWFLFFGGLLGCNWFFGGWGGGGVCWVGYFFHTHSHYISDRKHAEKNEYCVVSERKLVSNYKKHTL